MYAPRVALFNQYGIGNYRDLLIQYQSCIRFAQPKHKIYTKLVDDELAVGNGFVNFEEVLILFQALVSVTKRS